MELLLGRAFHTVPSSFVLHCSLAQMELTDALLLFGTLISIGDNSLSITIEYAMKLNPLIPKSAQLVISSHSNTAKSNTEMIHEEKRKLISK